MLLKRTDNSTSAEPTSAAALISALCDVHTRHDLDGKWRELVRVYEQRRNDDNLKEILDLSAPKKRLNDLTGWHLERMAVGELGGEMSSARGDVAIIRQESRRMKQVLQRVLDNGKKFQAKRETFMDAMNKQREALVAELDIAKEFMEQIHKAAPVDNDVVELITPVPVEKRLLATVKAPESSSNVDLSTAPSI
ncbi:hypothetical protein P43SY_009374 [Pythium insidiosum]|uniref:Uncharacterized protein n=1 Tax=Pythium insidiosum TaxID=114742 RepID=A0AAD5M203_PYTIN|nr:hypothetical protein P43SY_009374 [Pythium insidiosum]